MTRADLCETSGEYRSACCGTRARVLRGQGWPRCPRCGEPAAWRPRRRRTAVPTPAPDAPAPAPLPVGDRAVAG